MTKVRKWHFKNLHYRGENRTFKNMINILCLWINKYEYGTRWRIKELGHGKQTWHEIASKESLRHYPFCNSLIELLNKLFYYLYIDCETIIGWFAVVCSSEWWCIPWTTSDQSEVTSPTCALGIGLCILWPKNTMVPSAAQKLWWF